MAKLTMKTLAENLEQIQAQLAALSQRVEHLETAIQKPPVEKQAAGDSVQTEPAKHQITEEELIAVSAALAAYLGVRVRIKQIRLLGSRSWAQQGRVSIQASHKLY